MTLPTDQYMSIKSWSKTSLFIAIQVIPSW